MFTVVIKPSAEKQLDRLPSNIRARILTTLECLAAQPRPTGAVKLTGQEEFWRVRVGQYRVVYEIADDRLVVLVLRIAHRKDVYRGL